MAPVKSWRSWTCPMRRVLAGRDRVTVSLDMQLGTSDLRRPSHGKDAIGAFSVFLPANDSDPVKVVEVVCASGFY